MKRKIAGINLIAGVAIVALGGIVGCKSDEPAAPKDTDPGDTLESCDFDKDNDVPEGASTLELEASNEGFICPTGDQDWYSFKVPDGKTLLKVDLSEAGPAPSINPVYAIYEEDGTTGVAAPDNTESATVDAPLGIVHRISSGNYYIRVLDQANDRLDNYHPYTLTVSALEDPDSNEPNDDAADASALSDGEMTGYLAYRGDEDWFGVDSPARGLLSVTMTVDTGVAPAYRIVDASGQVVVDRKNDKRLSSYSYYDSLAAEGKYSVVVYYDDPLQFDTEVPYTMTASISPDPDSHESNDTPDEATSLTTSPIACGADWSEWTEATGYIASSGDIDWYKIDVTGSEKGILEAEVVFADQSTLPEGLEPSIRLIYPVQGNTCSTHQECQSLNATCTEDIECTKLGNTCLNTGYCAGAGSCMPGGNCGATLIAATSAQEMTSNPDEQPTSNPNRGTVRVAAPLFGVTTMYIAVEDYQGDTQSVTSSYTVRVRVGNDTDTHEPSEVYMNRPALENESVEPHLEHATVVPVHTCTGSAADDCCNDGTWIEGAISYTYDQDWYHYEHPCPTLDCMVRIHYQVDAGPVDTLMMLYVWGSLWNDTVIPSVSDDGDQAAKSGTCGGLAATDACLYAYRDHDGYDFSVRDTNYVSGGNQDDGTWDWNRDQHYRFCVEKVADTCQSPCKEWDDGCGPPN